MARLASTIYVVLLTAHVFATVAHADLIPGLLNDFEDGGVGGWGGAQS